MKELDKFDYYLVEDYSWLKNLFNTLQCSIDYDTYAQYLSNIYNTTDFDVEYTFEKYYRDDLKEGEDLELSDDEDISYYRKFCIICLDDFYSSVIEKYFNK